MRMSRQENTTPFRLRNTNTSTLTISKEYVDKCNSTFTHTHRKTSKDILTHTFTHLHTPWKILESLQRPQTLLRKVPVLTHPEPSACSQHQHGAGL